MPRFITAFTPDVTGITQFLYLFFNRTTGYGERRGYFIKSDSRIALNLFNDLSRTYPELYPELWHRLSKESNFPDGSLTYLESLGA